MLGCPGSLLARWFIPRLDRLNRDLPELRLQLSASEGELDPRKPGLDATLWYAEPPWPADMQVFELAAERIGPVLSPYHPRCTDLRGAPPSAVLDETLLHTPRGRRPGRTGHVSRGWIRRGCVWGRASNTCISCWKRRWPASAWPSRHSSWWPTTCVRVVCWRPGASSRPAPDWRSGYRRGEWTGAPSVWRSGCATNWSGSELRITDTANATTVALLSTCSFRRRRAGHAGVELGIGHRVLAARQRSGSDAFCFGSKGTLRMNRCACAALVAGLLLAVTAQAQPLEFDGIELSRDILWRTGREHLRQRQHHQPDRRLRRGAGMARITRSALVPRPRWRFPAWTSAYRRRP